MATVVCERKRDRQTEREKEAAGLRRRDVNEHVLSKSDQGSATTEAGLPTMERVVQPNKKNTYMQRTTWCLFMSRNIHMAETAEEEEEALPNSD